jgi:hypothetical protein
MQRQLYNLDALA